MNILTLEDLELEGKTVFLRVDMNTPVDPETGKLMEFERIKEASITINDLQDSKVVVGSHQGRLGRYDYISHNQHAEILSSILNKEVKFVEDVFGPTARQEISNLKNSEVLLLDNLRFVAEETKEYEPKKAANTFFVQRLYKLFDACVLDAFPTAHRAAPSIVGFSYLLPTCGGRLIVKELKSLIKVTTATKGPYTTILGGAKVSDRIEAIDALIHNNRADKVLLTGLIANVFFKALGKIKYNLDLSGEDELIHKAECLLSEYPQIFELPTDVAIERNMERVEIPIDELKNNETVLDIGSETVERYSKIIGSSGSIFLSGPPGMFEKSGFEYEFPILIPALKDIFHR